MLKVKVVPGSKLLLSQDPQTWTLVISPALVHWKSSATIVCPFPVPPEPPLTVLVVVSAKAKSRLRLTALLGSSSSVQEDRLALPEASASAHTASSCQWLVAV